MSEQPTGRTVRVMVDGQLLTIGVMPLMSQEDAEAHVLANTPGAELVKDEPVDTPAKSSKAKKSEPVDGPR